KRFIDARLLALGRKRRGNHAAVPGVGPGYPRESAFAMSLHGYRDRNVTERLSRKSFFPWPSVTLEARGRSAARQTPGPRPVRRVVSAKRGRKGGAPPRRVLEVVSLAMGRDPDSTRLRARRAARERKDLPARGQRLPPARRQTGPRPVPRAPRRARPAARSGRARLLGTPGKERRCRRPPPAGRWAATGRRSPRGRSISGSYPWRPAPRRSRSGERGMLSPPSSSGAAAPRRAPPDSARWRRARHRFRGRDPQGKARSWSAGRRRRVRRPPRHLVRTTTALRRVCPHRGPD